MKRAGGGIAKSLHTGRKRTEKNVVHPSSGNVFLDLGFSPAQAEYMLLRAKLMAMLTGIIGERRLTQCEAADLLGVSQPRVSDITRGRIERFTIDALVELLARAGVRLDVQRGN